MKIYTPATSANLGAGFDCLGLALNFHNEVELSKQSFMGISIEGEGRDDVWLRKNNTFVTIFHDILRDQNQKFKFDFHNRIPLSRGMGSSSSVIVGAIAAACKFNGIKTTKEQILNKALFYENHPDNIAPAVYGGFCANIVRDGKVLTQRCEISSDIKAVIVVPDRAISTEASRQLIPKNLPLKNAITNIGAASFITGCFFSRDYQNLKFADMDTIHQEGRMREVSELFEVRKTAYENGALLSVLSGSGSSFLSVVFRDDAVRLAKIFGEKFANFRILELEFDNEGVRVEE